MGLSTPIGVSLTNDETIGGTKTFSNSINVGNGGTNSFSLFGTSQSSHGPVPGDGFYVGTSTSVTTQSVLRSAAGTMQFDGTASSNARLVGSTYLAATGATSTGDLIGVTGNTPAGLIGSVGRVYHRGTGTVARAFGALGNLQSFTTGVVTDSADFFAQNPSIFSGTTWGTHSGLWVEGGSVSGTLTTRYGVRIDTLNGGSTKYGLWIQSDQSYLGGDVTTSGNLITDTIGKTLQIKSGTNAKSGTFTLVAGTKTIANTSVTANSVIIPTLKTASGTRAGVPDCVPTAGVGFTATGAATDNGTYNFVVIEVN